MATVRQRKAIEKVVENNGNVSRAMIEAGYSKAAAKNPKNLTESKAWAELMEKYLPDDMLAKRHMQFLNTEKITKVYQKGELRYEEETTDPSAVKALDMAYKLKKRYGDMNIGQALILNVSEASAKKYGIKPRTGNDNQ